MAKQQRDPAKEQYWRELVAQWRASGLSVREFCSLRQVRESSFYSWRRELQRRAGQRDSRPAFVPVRIVPAAAFPTAAVEVRCPSGHVVTVTNADGDTLRHLFAALAPEASC
jgi:transposase-like protein